MAFDAAAYEKKRKAWKSRKSMRWWPAINESRRALQKHGHTVRMNKKKNVDVRNDIETLIGILNAVLDSLILQMDDTDD